MNASLRIAFYAPLKAPDHPVPSGDRLMARQLFAALDAAGYAPFMASGLRSYLRDPADEPTAQNLQSVAKAEIGRLSADWEQNGAPALWFCYHPYYKSPDLIGPALCAQFGLPYVTAESSWSQRRNIGLWADFQAHVLAGLEQAALNICLTARDQRGIASAAPKAKTARLPPFIDPATFVAKDPGPQAGRLICTAMMRPGDKLQSYQLLAAALMQVTDLPWRLTIIGDGPARGEVEAAFAGLAPRIDWKGALPPEAVADELAQAAIYVWPGCGEAYGLAYLEAQAAGLPVLALPVAGVPEVVADGVTGLLPRAPAPASYADALRLLLTDAPLRQRLAAQARATILSHHSLESATARLGCLLAPLTGVAT